MKSKNLVAKSHLPRAYAELLSSIGFFIEHWGFKQVHGQVWACVFLAEHAVDARHIIQQLKLSKAAVSLAIRDLLDYDVIRELEKTKPSSRKYVSNPDLCQVVLNVLRDREKRILADVMSASRAFLDAGKDELQRVHVSREKLRELREMSECAHAVLDQVIKQRDGNLGGMLSLMISDSES